MKIIRWLLGHTFLIVLIVAVIYGYMFWGNLAGEDTPAGKALAYLSNEFEEVGEFVAAIEAKQEKLSQQESPGIESSDAHETSPDNEMSAVAESVEPGIQTQPAEIQAVEQTVEKTTFTAPVDENRRSDYAAIIDSRDNRREDRNDYRSVEQQQVTSRYTLNDTAAQQNAAGIIGAAEESVDGVVTTKSVDTRIQTHPTETQAVEQTVEKTTFTAPVDENRRSDYAPIIDSRDDSSDDISDNRREKRDDYRKVEQQQVTSSYNHNDTAVQQNAAGIIEAAVEPVDGVVTTNLQSKNVVAQMQTNTDSITKDTFISEEVSTQLDNVDEHGRLVQGELKQDEQDELKQDSQQGGAIRANWIAARKAFYQRKYDLSEQNYQKVIDNTEDNVDAYGELGNVYFNQGKKEQAASAYFEAAAILVRKGQENRARSLMGLLRHLDKNKAGELQKLIDSAAS